MGWPLNGRIFDLDFFVVLLIFGGIPSFFTSLMGAALGSIGPKFLLRFLLAWAIGFGLGIIFGGVGEYIACSEIQTIYPQRGQKPLAHV